MGQKNDDTSINEANHQQPKQVHSAWPCSVLAAIVDLYLLEMVFGFIDSLNLYFMKNNILKTVSVSLVIGFFIFTIVYHIKPANQVRWLSPGEFAAGRVLLDSGKQWTNPYGINRIGLFFIMILTFLAFRKFEPLMSGTPSFNELIGFLIRIIIITMSIILIGKGKLRGVAIINGLLLLNFGWLVFVKKDEIDFYGYFPLILFMIFTIISIIYHYKRHNK